MTFSRCSSVIVIVLAASPAASGESAREAYSRGLSLYSTGHYAEAADAFLAAYGKKPKPLILFNVGQAYRKSGDLERALTYYHRFLDEASPDERAPLAEETRKYVHELEAEKALRRSLTDKEDREEAAAAATPATAPAPPKPSPSEAPLAPPPAAVSPALTAPATAATTSPPDDKPRHRSLADRWWVWTAAGVAVAGLAVGLGVGLGSRSNAPSTALGTRSPSF